MKYLFYVLLINIFVTNAQSVWDDKHGLKFFNGKGVEISKKEFRAYAKENGHLTRGLDEQKNHMYLVGREEHGQISNRKALDSILSVASGKKIDSDKPLVIVYYPGPDPCNKTGTNDRERIRKRWKNLNKKLDYIADISVLNIAKTQQGLGKYKGIVDWYIDPENTVEQLFYEYHYPCSSFTVISTTGKYISVFGEFDSDYILKAVQLIQVRTFSSFSHEVSIPSDWEKFDWHGAKCYTPKAVYQQKNLRFDNNIFINEWDTEMTITEIFKKNISNFRKNFNTKDVRTRIENGTYGKSYIMEASYRRGLVKYKVKIISFKHKNKEVRIEIRFREDLYEEYIDQCDEIIKSLELKQ